MRRRFTNIPTKELIELRQTLHKNAELSGGEEKTSRILRDFLQLPEFNKVPSWKTFVDERNPRAKSFFEKNGWMCTSDTADEHGIFLLDYHSEIN